MAPRHRNSFKVRWKYGVVEYRAPGQHGRSGERGDSIGEVVFKAPAGAIEAGEICS